ncbi:GtrA family protein [Christensenellaceae bacterium OttesenSCG-928-K19]|nr:GtrA family protein [Christensenellaceae bacterium OttesenSCG-928-K19]
MDYQKIAVIYIKQTEDNSFIQSLQQSDFGSVAVIAAGDPLREAFRQALSQNYEYVLTLNEKDHFQLADVIKIADALLKDDSALYVGTRQCTKGKNSLAGAVFGFLAGISAADVETSLFGMSAALCAMMVNMKSTDKAYAMNILLEARANSITVTEVPTSACYDEPPKLSILARSFKLYQVFIKFSIAAMIAYVVDIGTFYLFEQVFHAFASEQKILFSTVLSRILCSIATYLLNKGAVFKSEAKTGGAVVRFIIMSVVQLIASWLLVWGIGSLLGGSDVTNTLLKIIIDLVIFMVSFPIQRDWVFKKTDKLLK